jgi:hypothetical protein
MLQDIRSYFREMNVLEQLADAMLCIEPEDLKLLTKTELDTYGLMYSALVTPNCCAAFSCSISLSIGSCRVKPLGRGLISA